MEYYALGSGAFVYWDAGVNHALYELSYGPQGTPPGQGTVLECNISQRYIPDLEAGVDYEVYVRARCDFARSEWTPWSDALLLDADTIAQAHVPQVAQGSGDLHIYPNPASGSLTVECQETIDRLELYSLHGQLLLSVHPAATSATLDVSSLPAGDYILLAHTASGTTARIVEIIKK